MRCPIINGKFLPLKKKSPAKAAPPEKIPVSSEESQRRVRLGFYVVIIIAACLAAGGDFWEQSKPEPVYPSSSLSEKRWLSDYLPSMRSTRGDTEVLVFNGRSPGGTLLILGGTHPNEPAGFITAVLISENIQVNQGRIIVIPRANASGFTATEPQEAFPAQFTIMNRSGRPRWFRTGSRYSNMLDGWPDPIVYRHHPSGQLLSGPETRNLNRAYPGRRSGSLTERIAFAITEIVKREKVDVVIDLHEAAPEYPVINAVVAHQRAVDIAAMATVELQSRGIDIQLEVSPENFHGLIHREIGDYSEANVFLVESAGALQGRMRGPTNTDLILKSIDPLYHRADNLGKLAVPFPEEGIPLEVRAGRHLETVRALAEVFSEFQPEKTISYSRIPDYESLQKHGIGFFLK